MGRLKQEMLDRTEVFADRMLNVVQALEKNRVYGRIVDQMVGCGTSVGANTAEADQAVSSNDFCKTLGIVLKELGESRFWMRMCVRRRWFSSRALSGLQDESLALSKILGSMVSRTRAKSRRTL